MLLPLLSACLVNDSLYQQRLEDLSDDDEDGVVEEDDCDDDDASVFPGATETCDDIDQDCDGDIDDGAIDATAWYADEDGDGHGTTTATATACDPPAGTVASSDDCDDANAAAYPGAAEVPYDSVD